MTPSMNMAAPKGTQAPVAGLAAIAQPAQAPKGKSPENMGQIMALARKMSDAQLADVLNGKSLDIPQYAAMTEAMGRKQLRTAVQGAQAMAQAKQPSLKERMMAEANAPQLPQMPQEPVMAADGGLMYADGGAIDANETAGVGGGIAELPAPNMEPMTMAQGGIIAFDGGGTAYDPNEVSLPEISGFDKKLWQKIKNKLGEWNEPWAPPKGTPAEIRGVMTGKIPAGTLEKEAAAATSTPNLVSQGSVANRDASRSLPAAPTTGVQFDPTAGGNPAVAALGNKTTSGGGGGAGGLSDLASYEDMLKRRTTDYLSKFEGMGDKKRKGLEELKNQLQGQLALQASSALLGNRNLAAAGAQFGQQAASTVGAGRAEKRGIEDAADQYDFNIAKAREAAEKGDMQLALQYQQLANQNKYQMGMLGVYSQRNAIMGEAGQLGKVQLGLAQADKQALAEAKQKFPVVTKTNQAAFDSFLRRRATELKMQNPLTKQYASLGSGDLGGGAFNVVQSLPKGASVVDLES